MDYEEALGAMLGFIGQPISVAITAGPRGQPSVTIAFIEGVLSRAQNRGPAVMDYSGEAIGDSDAVLKMFNEHDAQFFAVGDQGTGFYLSPQAFHDARWLDEDHNSLWIEHGPDVVIAVVGNLRRRSAA